MEPERRAVIDIGTNSVKLLLAEVAGKEVRPLWEESRQTRLGAGFYETRRLRTEAIDQTAEAVGEFTRRSRDQGAHSVRVIATSATREALNADELVAAVERSSGLRIEVISGDQEAEWTFQGATTDPRWADAAVLLLDVGGGSTEFIVGERRQLSFRRSYPVGAVRLMEKFPRHDPPQPQELAACRQWLKDFLAREVQPQLAPALGLDTPVLSTARGRHLVGTGGTASILGCMEAGLDKFDRSRLEATRLSRTRLGYHVDRLWAMPLLERQAIRGLPKNRADVILTGVAIYEAILDQFGFAELQITTRGLRFAALMDAG